MPEQRVFKPPTGTKASGRRLWAAILADFTLDDHETALLVEAVRTVDTLDALAARVRADGEVITTPGGVKVHPAVVEARQLRLVLARLLAALRMPDGEDGDGTAGRRQRRGGPRGTYGTGTVGR